jgi:thiopeptide-type bacteriocin biosynthesis protein
MPSESCLYTLIHASPEQHDVVLREFVGPLARELDGDTRLDSLFFARFNLPDWQIRFRVLGRQDWVQRAVRDLVQARLDPLKQAGACGAYEFATYQREYERYGGELGMRLSEKLFHLDTMACLELIEAEARAELARSRREYSLLMTERFLDLMRFDRERRLAFYEFGYSWTREGEGWSEDDQFRILEERYQALRPGLVELFRGDAEQDAASRWGGTEPARIANRCLGAMHPLVEELLAAHADGRIPQDLVQLAWSLSHMHCNRLSIEATGEAILRFFMHRLHQDVEIGTG